MGFFAQCLFQWFLLNDWQTAKQKSRNSRLYSFYVLCDFRLLEKRKSVLGKSGGDCGLLQFRAGLHTPCWLILVLFQKFLTSPAMEDLFKDATAAPKQQQRSSCALQELMWQRKWKNTSVFSPHHIVPGTFLPFLSLLWFHCALVIELCLQFMTGSLRGLQGSLLTAGHWRYLSGSSHQWNWIMLNVSLEARPVVMINDISTFLMSFHVFFYNALFESNEGWFTPKPPKEEQLFSKPLQVFILRWKDRMVFCGCLWKWPKGCPFLETMLLFALRQKCLAPGSAEIETHNRSREDTVIYSSCWSLLVARARLKPFSMNKQMGKLEFCQIYVMHFLSAKHSLISCVLLCNHWSSHWSLAKLNLKHQQAVKSIWLLWAVDTMTHLNKFSGFKKIT